MNAATTLGDLHVVETSRAHLLLVRARVAEDRVGMRVDEPGSENSPGAVDFSRRGKSPPEVGLRADRLDPIADDNDGGAR